ncbi:MAG: glycosyltransferase [Gemmataceae bacterium]
MHLTSSTFFGGPERQMLGLARTLSGRCSSVFCSFSENGRCFPFLEEARRLGFTALALKHDTPHLWAATREIMGRLRNFGPDVLCCQGYKADLLGLIAARLSGVPVIAVSRGWTAESRKVRFYEEIDRRVLRWMDRVVCVSAGQAAKVGQAGVADDRILVIRNAIDTKRFTTPYAEGRRRLQKLFPSPPKWIMGAAGRLSPEKGFSVLIEAARAVIKGRPSVGFVLFGEGRLQAALSRQIIEAGLGDSFVMGGFCADLDSQLPGFDVLVQSSLSEGLPNILLEGLAAGVPVVATAVGGTPELVEEGVNGYLVPAGEPAALAKSIEEMLGSESRRRSMGQHGRDRVGSLFTFEAQADAYLRLFNSLQGPKESETWTERAASQQHAVQSVL